MALSIQGTVDRIDGLDRWGREARSVSRLAARLGIEVDADTLTTYDVRELMSLQVRLHDTLCTKARVWRALNRRRVARALQHLSRA